MSNDLQTRSSTPPPQQPPRQPSPVKGPEPEPQSTEPLPPYSTSIPPPPKPALSNLGIRLEHLPAEISYRQILELRAAQQQRQERDLEQGGSRGVRPFRPWYRDRPGMVCYGLFVLIYCGSIAAIYVWTSR